ncbi:hypothetical protein CAEBREN_25256 [Caenorhabditis brenneri]|uniref:G-protein coupled receptors family 1 profile domain-containing protein n=1 Tax=Caenorhabditis brenneri TaxID=135651 RepID=G0M9T3_CAEBE|nr:hypothetical protein CAEBREN_25256 [Caenorhabditis brenneri]
MAGIAICDLTNSCTTILQYLPSFVGNRECWNSHNFPFLYLLSWAMTINDVLRRVSAWLGISMAFIRYLVIKYLMKSSFDKLSEAKFGLKTIFTSLISSSLISSLYYSHQNIEASWQWKPDPGCTGYPDNYTETYYVIIADASFYNDPWFGFRTFMIVDGFMKIVPSVILPILTFLLTREIRASRKKKKRLSTGSNSVQSSKTDNVTIMVTIMTIASTLAEGPMGFSYMLQGVAANSMGLLQISSDLVYTCQMFVAMNSSTHCFISLFVSSLYRKTAKELFCCGIFTRKKSKVIIVPASLKDGCFNANSYKIQFVRGWFTGIDSALRRLSAYLGIFMALIRFLVIKFAMNGKFDFLSEPKFALKTVFISLVISVLLSAFNFSHYFLLDLFDWSPANSCNLLPENAKSDIYYQLAYEETYVKAHWLGLDAYLAVDGVLKVSFGIEVLKKDLVEVSDDSSSVFTDFDSFVGSGAGSSKEEKSEVGGESTKPDHVTKMITIMTILSMIAEGPLGIAYLIQGLVGDNDGLVLICDDLIRTLYFLVAINSSTHFFVCLVVSSQYRSVAKGMFICERKQRVQPIVQSSKAVKTSTSQVRVDWNPSSYTLQFISAWFIAIDDVLRRQSAYLGILMALIRYLVIKFSLNPRFQQLSKTIFGIKTVTVTLILSSFVSSVYFSHFVLEDFDGWTPTDQCKDEYPVNYTEKLYLGHADLNFILSPYINADNWMLVSGGLKMVPTILLPILTVLLVAELQKAKANRRKIFSNEQPDHTTKMVALMTVTSMISDGSIGIAYILQGFFSTSNGFLLISFDLITMFSAFVALNASMHCLICLVVSSQYRKAVKEFFGCFLKKKVATNRLSKASVTSKTSVSQMVFTKSI